MPMTAPPRSRPADDPAHPAFDLSRLADDQIDSFLTDLLVAEELARGANTRPS